MADAAGQNPEWDLSGFYASAQDPELQADLARWERLEEDLHRCCRGKLAHALGDAIRRLAEIRMLSAKIFAYLYLLQSKNTADTGIQAVLASAERRVAAATGAWGAFFDIELAALDEADIERQAARDPVVAHHAPWIRHNRVFKPHLLSEEVESALIKRSPFGTGAWSELYDEFEADLRFDWHGAPRDLEEMLDLASHAPDAAERAEALRVVNDGLGGWFAKYAARNLYVIAGKSAVERAERKYAHPMDRRNKANRLPDAIVEALHQAVMREGPALARRYYRLKAQHLAMPRLAWSDRNAPLPFADTTRIPFAEAWRMVLEAYRRFSPTLAAVIERMGADRRIDAARAPGRRSGAYNYSITLPGNMPASFTFLNYLGTARDVMTLAHELGHGVHGILAGEAQGALMQNVPTAYAETASVFGEMIAFAAFQEQCAARGATEARLALLMGKIEDGLNTIVRQIGFSNFERRLHGMSAGYTAWQEPRRLSPEDLDALWLETVAELYGAEGDVFTYQNASHLWSYISHFHRPFYVYGYAFGELLTQSLYAVKDAFGDRFEPLYLDLPRAGSSKSVPELLAPFNLDPADPAFWSRGLSAGLGAMITEAEALSK